ncbi:transcriptional regulator [Anaerobacillus alkalidiazotrophicus]|uniref:Transcriptional regulator n=1 Tax=Anaerobacillus alkalidiazotrophicus TaxID=472963 RepID=A0A1S2MBV2_9BACI|nr:helix-turn-helix domain-containing protein [Anaerobacillus alkalidiazotrophicus]OIJ22034.1 transcriptional regulator [Anaerobacillus alkalidiazotrophicus]
MLSQRLREARKRKKLTQEDLAKKLKTTKGTVSNYENGYSTPSNELLKDLADILDVTTDYLLGRTNKEKEPESKLPVLNSKDERDIAKKLEAIINDLEGDTSLAFDGEPMDDNTRELVLAQIESNLRLAKQLAKKKFTPKKYQKE